MGSQKANKIIRKHLRKEIHGQVRIEMKWRFPFNLNMHFFIMWNSATIFNKITFKYPWIKTAMPTQGWMEIKRFPPWQWKFEFRVMTEAVISGKRIQLDKG